MALPSAAQINVLRASSFPVDDFVYNYSVLDVVMYVKLIVTRKNSCPSNRFSRDHSRIYFLARPACTWSCYLNEPYTEFSRTNVYLCGILLLRKEWFSPKLLQLNKELMLCT